MADYALMPVGVKRTSDGVEIRPQSGAPWEVYVAWRMAGGIPDPYVAPVAPPETLAEAKARKRWQIKAAGMARIQLGFPAIDSFDALQLVREIYLSIAPAARQPTTDWQRLIDTYQVGQAALAQVTAATTIAQVDAVTVTWP